MLAVLLCLLAIQETRREAWPSGTTKAEYQVVLDEHGLELREGPSRSFFEDGTLESQGAFRHGEREGPWEFFHPNGARAAAGSFAGGLESGPWETWYPGGQPESKGSYVRGARDKRWNFWAEDGTKDLAASGLYKIEVYRSKEDGRRYRGYIVDNQRQGIWTSYWPDDRIQFEGAFAAGQRDGRWVFLHPDGVPSSLILTGEYSGGTWAGRIEVPEPPPFDPARFPPLEPAPEGWPAHGEELAAALREALAKGSLDPELSQELERVGFPAIPIVLRLFAALDPESVEGRSGMGFLEDQVLRLLCAHHALSRHGSAGPPDAPAARELVRAWLSLWALTRNDPEFWKAVGGPSNGAGLRDPLQDPPLLERDPRYSPQTAALNVTVAAESAPLPAAFRSRFGKEKADRMRGAPPGTKEAIDGALRWLVEHQSKAGNWDNDGFASECGRLGKGSCDGPGGATHDVGATGLALLAFLGDGHTPTQGAHQKVVLRALEWLVQQQSASGEGLIGERAGFDFFYDHAIATAALCEALGLGGEAFRAPAEHALDYLQRARNPQGAWRYDMPPVGANDTSVTGWAVTALLAAQRAGLAIDPEALPAALGWIDRVSDPDSGLVGYSALGELSSRTPANEHYPREKGEAMTAVGLWIRLQLGQSATLPIVKAHAKRIATRPPEPDPEGNDHYYWYYASSALHALGAPYWKGWESDLKKGVLASQSKDGETKGSWEPNGPWGYVMGRVCTTALLALTLECYYRE